MMLVADTYVYTFSYQIIEILLPLIPAVLVDIENTFDMELTDNNIDLKDSPRDKCVKSFLL